MLARMQNKPSIYDFNGSLPIPKGTKAGDKVKLVVDLKVESMRESLESGKRVQSYDLRVDKAKPVKPTKPGKKG